MKKYILPILCSFLVAGIVSAFTSATLFIETWEGIKKVAVYSEEQADKLFSEDYELYQEKLSGVAYTTISGSDTMKNFPTTYNANNVLFDIGKIDVGTTSVASITTLPGLTTANALTSASSLATVGTITSGSWNATAIPVSKGGTGTTSPTSDYVMLGNGSSGLKVVAGQGTSGQLLTSNGVGSAPTWQNSVAVPTGSITAYASSTAPTGWLLCDGSSKDTTTYADLFAIVGYLYGGTGANFNLPNLTGRNIVMASSTLDVFDTVGETGGATSTVLVEAQIPAHTHTIANNTLSGGSSIGGSGSSAITNVGTGSTGGGQSHSNLDPYIVLNYIIKF